MQEQIALNNCGFHMLAYPDESENSTARYTPETIMDFCENVEKN